MALDERIQQIEADFKRERGAEVADWHPSSPASARAARHQPSENDSGAEYGPVVLRASDVERRRVEWLWPGRIPRGKLTVLDGDPGLGKSTLMVDVAARASQGSPMPDGQGGGDPAGVVLLTAEDDLGDTVRPRLEAAGADLGRVVALDGIADDEGTRPATLPGDAETLRYVVEDEGASMVVIDPLMAFLGSDVNSHRDQDVRRALHALARLAEETGAAVVVIRHLNKAGGAHPLYRGGGSIGIIGAARAGLLVAADPDDEAGTRRVLASTKANLSALAPSLAFSMTLAPDDPEVVRVVWEGESDHDAAALLRGPQDPEERSLTEEAMDVLRETLAEGPVHSKEALGAVKADVGCEERTVKEAKRRLGVVSEKQGAPGKTGRWYWRLPKGAGSSEEPPTPRNLASLHPSGLTSENAAASPASFAEGGKGADALEACCEGGSIEPRCGLCPRSPTYYAAAET